MRHLFGPLTVLIGFNAAGKSKVMDALRFVSDALCTSIDQALNSRGGLDQLLHRPTDDRQVDTFTIEIDLMIDVGGTPAHATYGFEIGTGEQRHPTHTVRREWCELTLSDEGTLHFNADPSGSKFRFNPLRGESSEAMLSQALKATPQNARFVNPELLGRSPDRLALPALAIYTAFDIVESTFRRMSFYELDSATLRKVEDAPTPAARLGSRGENLGQMLGRIAEEHPEVKEELDGYLRSLIPQALGVDERRDGDFSTIEARFWDGDSGAAFWAAVNAGTVRSGDPHVKVFRRHALSEGTVRGAGVLAALFQPEALADTIPLIAIEEPEVAIHPSRVGALYDAAYEASRRTQVIITTQSSDFLDSEYADASHLLAVEMVDGETRIGSVDDATRQFLTGRPSQLAELHRQGQLRPAAGPSADSAVD